ncbi:uncharacterized protein LOC132278439 [Cornus florida]|uniref:uncharacterized protein LOC132278439 n=1 Tax=Cornus florida TaxID=4283 RepID=UPI00289AB9A0|nr:uncharacterized protein LOC132278439 [Cornus florida]
MNNFPVKVHVPLCGVRIVNIGPMDTVLDLRNRVQEIIRVDLQNESVFFEGLLLDNHQYVMYYSLYPFSRVDIGNQQPPAPLPVHIANQQPPAPLPVHIANQQPPAPLPVHFANQQPPPSALSVVSQIEHPVPEDFIEEFLLHSPAHDFLEHVMEHNSQPLPTPSSVPPNSYLPLNLPRISSSSGFGCGETMISSSSVFLSGQTMISMSSGFGSGQSMISSSSIFGSSQTMISQSMIRSSSIFGSSQTMISSSSDMISSSSGLVSVGNFNMQSSLPQIITTGWGGANMSLYQPSRISQLRDIGMPQPNSVNSHPPDWRGVENFNVQASLPQEASNASHCQTSRMPTGDVAMPQPNIMHNHPLNWRGVGNFNVQASLPREASNVSHYQRSRTPEPTGNLGMQQPNFV